MARWADDLWVFLRLPISPGVKLMLRVLLAERFYGHRLKLVRSRAAEAFGFRVGAWHGLVAVRPVLKFVGVEMPSSRKYRRPLGNDENVLRGRVAHKVYHGGQQFRSPQVEFGVGVGYVQRVLDCSNEGREEVLAMVLRALTGLLLAGVPRKIIRRVLRRARVGAHVDLSPVKLAVEWPKTRLRRWAEGFDRRELARRTVEDNHSHIFEP